MSERTPWKLGDPYETLFEVFDPLTDAPITGLVVGGDPEDFVITSFKNGTALTPGGGITITEVGAGRYRVEYTPDTLGHWYVSVRNETYNKRGYVDEIQAKEEADLSTATITAIAKAVLTTPLSAVEASIAGVRCLAAAVQRIRNKVARTGADAWVVYKSDDVTPAWTVATTRDGAQQPVISADPS